MPLRRGLYGNPEVIFGTSETNVQGTMVTSGTIIVSAERRGGGKGSVLWRVWFLLVYQLHVLLLILDITITITITMTIGIASASETLLLPKASMEYIHSSHGAQHHISLAPLSPASECDTG